MSETTTYVWGSNFFGQLATKERGNTYLHPKTNILNIPILSIACGEEFSLLLSTSKQLYSLGSNNYGALGLSNPNYLFQTQIPQLVSKLANSRINSISAGWNHSVAILECGSAYIWGRGDQGQIGKGSLQNFHEPEPLEIKWVREASCGARHTVLITTENIALATGANEQGQLGIGNRERQIEFVPVNIEEPLHKVACGVSHTLFLTKQNIVFSTGSNNLFQLGLGKNIKSIDSPEQVLENIVEIAAGNHSAAINFEGNLFLWGKGAFGTLDKPYNLQQKIKKVSVNGSSGVGIDYQGNVYSWGNNSNGELGTGDTENLIEPTKIDNLKVQDIAMGAGFVIAIGKHDILQKYSNSSQKVLKKSMAVYSNCLSIKQIYQSVDLDIIQQEKNYFAKNLEIEQTERTQLEQINQQLKAKVQNLIDGPEGINQKNIKINEQSNQIQLLNERINDLSATIQEQCQINYDTKQELINEKQNCREKDNQIEQLKQKCRELENLLEGRTNEFEQNQVNIIQFQEQIRAQQFQDSEQLKALQHQIQELNLKLGFEKESKEKIVNMLNNEKTNFYNLNQNYHELEDALLQTTQENELLQNQLENSLAQLQKLSEALENAQNRIENLTVQNQKLLSDISILRTSLYSDAILNQDKLPSGLMEQFTSLNQELQDKLKNKEEEILNLKKAYNQLKNQKIDCRESITLSKEQQIQRSQQKPKSGTIKCLKENTSYLSTQAVLQEESFKSNKKKPQQQIEKENEQQQQQQQQYINLEKDTKNPGKSIQDLLESAHKHAKLMKRILKDLEKQEGSQKIPKLTQRNNLEPEVNQTPIRQLNYDIDSSNWKKSQSRIAQSDLEQSSFKQKNDFFMLIRYEQQKMNIENDYSKNLSEIKQKLAKLQNARDQYEKKVSLKKNEN